MTRRALWLVGDERIGGSPSPRLYDAVFGVGTYLLHPDADADRAFAAAEAVCRGINVTAPHKVAAARRYAHVLDADARRVGAVNTVVYDDDGRPVIAANTDVAGARAAWRRAGFHLEGRTVAIVGAGGAARAVVAAAVDAGAARILAHARRRDAAAGIVALAASLGVDAAVDDDAAVADFVVVAASDLDAPEAVLASLLAPGGSVHDLRYGPRARPTRDAALRRGARFADGATMLLAQAERAADLFAGAALAPARREAMARALAAWLREL